jgi:choline-sulfatase
MDEKLRKAHKAGYRGNLAFADDCIGVVYDGLEQLGLLENTIVVYTSDHGEMDGDHGLYQKFCLFDPSVKVPLIVSFPNRIPENRVTEALTEYIGLFPTLADLTDTALKPGTVNVDTLHGPENIDARSFANLLLHPNQEGPDAVFCEFSLRSNLSSYMIRKKQYKLIYHDGGSKNELYDLLSDPGESVNLIDKPELQPLVGELRERLFAWYNPSNNPWRKPRITENKVGGAFQ